MDRFNHTAAQLLTIRQAEREGYKVHNVLRAGSVKMIRTKRKNRSKRWGWVERDGRFYSSSQAARYTAKLQRRITQEGRLIHKGIMYIDSTEDALMVGRKIGGRIVWCDLGWAVQYRISGPYFPEEEQPRPQPLPQPHSR